MSEKIVQTLPNILKEDWERPGVQNMVNDVLHPHPTSGEPEAVSIHKQIAALRMRRNRDLQVLYEEVQATHPHLVALFKLIDEGPGTDQAKKASKRDVAYEFAKNDPEVQATYRHYHDLEDYIRRGMYSVMLAA